MKQGREFYETRIYLNIYLFILVGANAEGLKLKINKSSTFADAQSTVTWRNLDHFSGFPSSSVVKNPPIKVGDRCLTPELGRFHGGGNGNPLQ